MYDRNEPRWQFTSTPTNPDGAQWQRPVGDGYEMVELVKNPLPEGWRWMVVHGTFSVSDYDQSEIDFQREQYHLDDDTSDAVLACCLFEACMADFDCESFDTLREASAYIDSIVR